MEIIKDTTKQQVKCIGCGSELRICEKDLCRDYYDYHGIPNIDIYYYCPCCGEKNIIS